jgi:N-acetylmuramoyl-L-alanine amidase
VPFARTKLYWTLAVRLVASCAAVVLCGCATQIKDTSRTFTTVVIDAGHGGHDSGARGVGGIREKNAALDVAQRLEGHLRGAGFKTVMTRTDDRFIPLGTRVAMLNAEKNAMFVSVHFNYSRRRAVHGAEIYYHDGSSRPLAMAVQRELASAAANRGVLKANFHVLKNAQYPAILVECGYLTNRSEGRRAASAKHRELLARKIAAGIINYRYPQGRPAPASALAYRDALDAAGAQPQ